MATPEEFDETTTCGLEDLRTAPRAVSARYDSMSNLVVVELSTGYAVSFAPQRSQALARANPEDLAEIEIDYLGLSLFFPRLDDGLLVGALARGRFGSDRWEAAWQASHPVEDRTFAPTPHNITMGAGAEA